MNSGIKVTTYVNNAFIFIQVINSVEGVIEGVLDCVTGESSWGINENKNYGNKEEMKKKQKP